MLKRILYYTLIAFLVLAMIYNLIFDMDVFALIVNIFALTGVLVLPRMKK